MVSVKEPLVTLMYNFPPIFSLYKARSLVWVYPILQWGLHGLMLQNHPLYFVPQLMKLLSADRFILLRFELIKKRLLAFLHRENK